MPFDAIEVDNQRHRHSMLRHRMMEVVRKYNQVCAVQSSQDRSGTARSDL